MEELMRGSDSGVGYGGSCSKGFPVLISVVKSNGVEARVLRCVDEVKSAEVPFRRRQIAVSGISFE